MTTQIFKAFNEITRKFEEIDIDLAELIPGQQVVKMFWCKSNQRFVTVPGASLFVIGQDFSLIPVQE